MAYVGMVPTDISLGTTKDYNKWHHATCAVNGQTGQISGYFDGTAATSAVGTIVPNFYASYSTSDWIRYITVLGDGGYAFGGSSFTLNSLFVDDVAVYSSALADAEINQIYAESFKRYYAEL